MAVLYRHPSENRFHSLVWNGIALAFSPFFLIAALLPARRQKFIFGSNPIISNRYWAEALKAGGRDTETIMEGHFSINDASDFDRYFKDFCPRFVPAQLRNAIGGCLALIYVLRRARVMHLSFTGFVLNTTILWKWESWFYRLAGIKTIVMPFGADFWMYSRLIDPALRYGLLASYPYTARVEGAHKKRVDHWVRHADAMLTGFMIDGISRWDVTTPSFFMIDTEQWTAKSDYSKADGHNGSVKIIHTPNHRGFKGTEYLLAAVEQLQAEGLLIDLELLEGIPNSEVRTRMGQADILAEQFIWTGYALSGIEGMASGLPVIANLDNESYTRVYRRNSYLDACPILSGTPESLKDVIRVLVEQPDLRRQLGLAGREYAEKYHSYAAARHLFESIFEVILDGRDVDIMNLYHPLKSPSGSAATKVAHPLIENRFVED